MNLKLLVGIALFLIGIATAAYGIVNISQATDRELIVAGGNRGWQEMAGRIAIPLIAGLSLATGGLLIGVSLGNWKHPRTHHEPGDEVVDPEGYQRMKHV
jgi:hypothetical protein